MNKKFLTFSNGVEIMRQLIKAKRTALYSLEFEVLSSSTISLNRDLSELKKQKKNNKYRNNLIFVV